MKRKDALWVMQMCRDRDARSEAEREAFDTAIEALKSESIFTADRPRGEWIVRFDGNEQFCFCSVCKEQWYEDDLYMGGNEFPNYCPNCGADMRGDEE